MLTDEIVKSLDKVEDESVHEAYYSSFTEVRGKSKRELVALLKDIYDELDNQNECIVEESGIKDAENEHSLSQLPC